MTFSLKASGLAVFFQRRLFLGASVVPAGLTSRASYLAASGSHFCPYLVIIHAGLKHRHYLV